MCTDLEDMHRERTSSLGLGCRLDKQLQVFNRVSLGIRSFLGLPLFLLPPGPLFGELLFHYLLLQQQPDAHVQRRFELRMIGLHQIRLHRI